MTENIKEALNYAVELSKREKLIVSNKAGKEFYDENKYELTELDATKYPSAIELTSLTSLVSYIKDQMDVKNLGDQRFILHVESPTRVSFQSELDSDQKRAVYAVATAITPQFVWDRFYDIESFNIKLLSAFVESEHSTLLLELSSKIKIENGVELSDDGVSQVATVKNGVASIGKGKLPNPVALKPYRTFQEVNQPISKFTFRLNDNPGAALFEADGSMWKVEAKGSIAAYLKEELKEQDNIIILA